MKLLFILVNLLLEGIYLLLKPLLYPYLAFKGYLASIKAEGEDLQRGLLLHAASMGEVAAIRSLVSNLSVAEPTLKIGITTTTLTGLQQAKQINPQVQAWLSVLDIPHLRKKQLSKINPGLICIVETEIWPNLLAWAAKNKVPVLFLNARMSSRSLAHYLKIKRLLHFLEKPINEILAQSQTDAQRFMEVFTRPVHMAGNLKFCLKLPDYDQASLRKGWGYTSEDLIICFGSTRPGEEAMILSLWPGMKKRFPQSKLIIALRHPKRITELGKLLASIQVQLSSQKGDTAPAAEILIIDELGILDKAYAICDIAIVGGSFLDFGGHNPLEPAYYAKPVIMGKFHHSCQESVSKLVEAEGLLLSSPETLSEDLGRLLDDAELRHRIGNQARQVLKDNSSAISNHAQAILQAWRVNR